MTFYWGGKGKIDKRDIEAPQLNLTKKPEPDQCPRVLYIMHLMLEHTPIEKQSIKTVQSKSILKKKNNINDVLHVKAEK